MPDTTMSPNMNLIIPTVSVDPGPDWALNINASLSIIDQHNHAPGSGVPVTQAGISLSASGAPFDSLSFASTNAYALRSVRFTAQSAALALVTDIGCLYEAGVDLYYNDGSGNQIRLTQGGSIVGTAGSISGLPSGTASASYSGGTFVWQSATNTAANMDAGSYILRNSTASSKGLTLQPPNAMAADYSLTLPSLPASTLIMRLDSSGNMSAALGVDNSTIEIASNTLRVPTSGITATQLAPNSVTTSKILDDNVTSDKIQDDVDLTGIPTVQSLNIVTAGSNPSPNKPLVILRGGFNSGGVLNYGEGFTPSRTATGIYQIQCPGVFSAQPALTAVAESAAGNYSCKYFFVSTAVLEILVTDSASGTLTNSDVSFIAIGPGQP